MKLNGMLVAVAMMFGSLGALGCNTSIDPTADAVAPEETAASAPVEEAQESASPEQNSLRYRYGYSRAYYAPYAPPRARYEYQGRAPSRSHFWAPGYHRWNGRQHMWVGGRWEAQRTGYYYVSPRWESRSARWQYIPGRWVRR